MRCGQRLGCLSGIGSHLRAQRLQLGVGRVRSVLDSRCLFLQLGYGGGQRCFFFLQGGDPGLGSGQLLSGGSRGLLRFGQGGGAGGKIVLRRGQLAAQRGGFAFQGAFLISQGAVRADEEDQGADGGQRNQ